MSDTPRTDANAFADFERGGDVVLADFARTLEREFADEMKAREIASQDADRWREHAKREREQRDRLADALREFLNYYHDCRLCTIDKAREALAAVKLDQP